jgi:Glycosyl hydrolases family 38 N-terminal domain/Alpha mannosidase middle domain
LNAQLNQSTIYQK